MSALSQHFNWCGLLLALTSDVLTLCSETEDDSQLPASGAAAVELWPLQMQLAAAALQYTTKWVQELPKGSELPGACALLTSCAFEAVGNAAVSLSFVPMLAHLQHGLRRLCAGGQQLTGAAPCRKRQAHDGSGLIRDP